MSYGPPPPPSSGTNPYGELPEGGSSSSPSGPPPSYGTPPVPPPPPPPGPMPNDAAVPAYGTPPPTGPSYGAPPPTGQQYGGPAGNYSPYASASRYPGPGGPGYGGWMTSTRDNGKGTGALVLGIISVVLCFTTIIGLGLAVGALLLGIQGRKAADAGTADNRGVATAGMVLGCIGIGCSVLASLSVLAQLAQG